MLAFHPLRHERASPARLAELLEEFKSLLHRKGMASMDEYGDMLQWGVAREGGAWRKFHAFHPDWCSFDDRYWGTIHYHAGWIRGTILAGHLEHNTYEAAPDPAGDRFYQGQPHRLTKHTAQQPQGTVYTLPAMVPHWIKPKALTLTFFEEEDNGQLGDLINPVSEETDDHRWTQEQAEALLPEIVALIDARLSSLRVTA
ncbi:MAG TPA: hypothetical protein VM370_05415 [Candidatus Thermoplasmatota archaeon]|nr:hypothetical protein [Candidatus Thermoplasmatota archaeon]